MHDSFFQKRDMEETHEQNRDHGSRAEKGPCPSVRTIVVATNSGSSVSAAQHAFGEGYRFFAVGNPANSREHGLCFHSGIDEQTHQKLDDAGKVILVDQTLFHDAARCEQARKQHTLIRCAYARRSQSPISSHPVPPAWSRSWAECSTSFWVTGHASISRSRCRRQTRGNSRWTANASRSPPPRPTAICRMQRSCCVQSAREIWL